MKLNELRQIIREEVIGVLYEGKQVGLLYHLMDESSLIYNLKNDRIGTRKDDQISFSRLKTFKSIPNHLPQDKVFARFIINGDKLSNKHKIFPVDDMFFKPKNYNKNLDLLDLFENKYDEFEERVIGVINNVGKYIIEINIYKDVSEPVEALLKEYIKKYPQIKLNYG